MIIHYLCEKCVFRSFLWQGKRSNPANICLDDIFIKTNIFALVIHLQKTSLRRLDQDQYIRLSHMSSRRLQDVFKTSSRRLAKTSSRRLQKCLQDIFKTSPRRFEDVFKTSSKRLAMIPSRCFEDVSSS